MFESMESRTLLALTVTIDYSLDNNTFFDTQAKKNLFQRAADTIVGRFDDDLSAIAPGGVNTWYAEFTHPRTGETHQVANRSIAANEIVVYAGGRDLGVGEGGGAILGLGGPGGALGASGTQAFVDGVIARGEPGAIAEPPTDFGWWGGVISFTNRSGVDWYFGETTAGLTASEVDFFTVALHEMAHLLGFGTANSWPTNVGGTSFGGAGSVAEYDGVGSVPLDSSLGHWADGTTDGGLPTLMDPLLDNGSRVYMTKLDFAGLDDLGWDVSQPGVTISPVTGLQTGESGSQAAFTVVLTRKPQSDVTINISTSDATEGAPTVASLTFTHANWNDPQTVTVVGANDAIVDGAVAYSILTAPVVSDDPTYAGFDPADVSLTNLDDEPPPSLSINDVSVTEGNSGTTNATFTVTLSAASGQTVTVNWTAANFTAIAPSDYASGSGTLTFTPGETSKTITVVVNGDLTSEPNETFRVNLGSATNATILDGLGVGTILNDDVSLRINDVTVTEGTGTAVNALFSISLSSAPTAPVTVRLSTASGTATTADYAPTFITITFNVGETQKVWPISVTGDALDESNENFFVNLSNPTNATIADSQGRCTIIDNDPAPSIRINDVSVTEGDSGATNATFTVTLSAASGKTVTVNWAAANNTAIAPSDYAAGSGSLTFAPGVTSRTVTVAVQGDSAAESLETFFVNLSGSVNATILDGQGIATIIDDDNAPTLSINDVSITEGDNGATNATFTVTLSAASGQTVTVNWAAANSTAIAPGDYAAGGGALTFAPGETSKTLVVAVQGDLLDEPNEGFLVNLSGPTNATILDGQGIATIIDDDPPPNVGWVFGIGQGSATPDDGGAGLVVDAAGSTYTVGSFLQDGDPGTFPGSADIYVVKLSAEGSILWSRTIGGSLDDRARRVALAADGSVIVVGFFRGQVDFAPAPDPAPDSEAVRTSLGSLDVFVLRLAGDDGRFLRVDTFGNSGGVWDQGNAVATDAAGNVFVAGQFGGTVDFDPGPGNVSLTAASGSADAFVAKFNAAHGLEWTKKFGGTSTDVALSLAVDAGGAVHLGGYFQGTGDFDPGAGTVNHTSAGGLDAFLVKLDSAGNYVWSRRLGGVGTDLVAGLQVASTGDVYLTGPFQNTVDFDPGSGVQNLSAQGFDAYVVRLSATGDFVWARQIGSTGDDRGASIVVTPDSRVIVSGFYQGVVDFDLTAQNAGADVVVSAGGKDGFVLELDAAGTFQSVRGLGGSLDDEARTVTIDGTGATLVTGYFQGTATFPTGSGTASLTSAGGKDLFVARIAPTSANTLASAAASPTDLASLNVLTTRSEALDLFDAALERARIRKRRR